MPTTTQAILEEDGTQVALEQVAEKVGEAEQVILRLLSEEGDRDWSIRELQDAAAYQDSLSPWVISIAFMRLRKAGTIRLDSNLRIQAV